MSTKTILAVDDEPHILELLQYNLEGAGYAVVKAETGEEAVEHLENKNYDFSVVLLDWMLPGIDGIEVLKRIRMNERYKNIPVIMLTAKSDEISKVVGLEIGADDYLSKPFGVHELLARIKAVLRRSGVTEQPPVKDQEEIIAIDGLVINKTRRTVEIDGKNVELALKEYELLYLLAKNRGIVFTRENLLEKIWGYDYLGETRTVDVHVRNIRKKIEKDDTAPLYIKTVRGIGYKFD
ncbi:response regulator transcription factor [Anaerosporobacter faecicola]|uniref:response regulator transcription factor n=1 Tax=Anaerosporobacter faecicola TaxID=2718714 RepID=UPI0014391652|nr:response regulator transcription factor [Anaerosporobacter faecicola]